MKITVDPRANKRAVMDALCATLDLISAELPIGALLISRLGRLCAGPSFGQLLPCHVARADRIGGGLLQAQPLPVPDVRLLSAKPLLPLLLSPLPVGLGAQAVLCEGAAMADPRLAAALREIAAGLERAAALLEDDAQEVPTDIDAQKAKRARSIDWYTGTRAGWGSLFLAALYSSPMPCHLCGHTYFQHGGAGGRCNVPGCSCLAWVEPPDPAELARAQEAVRRAAVARAERQRDEAEAELARLRLSDPGTLEGTIATLLREGAAVLSVAESMEVNPRVVYEVARAIGALRGKGRPVGAARAEAIRLHKEGMPIAQIASQMGLPPWRVRRFLGMVATAAQK